MKVCFSSPPSQPCPIKASLSDILITDTLLSCCTIIINIYKDDPDSTKKDQDLKIGHTSFVHINQNTLFSVYSRKYNLFFLNSRSAVFLLSLHLSSCEICTQKDNRIKFSQDNICFAECIPDTGHHPAPGGRESEVPTLQFKPPKHSKSSSWFQRSHYLQFFFWTLVDPPKR